MTNVVIALIAAFGAGTVGLAGQLLLGRQAAKLRREEKQEDWARQDKVAEQAERAAALLLERQDAVAAQAAEAASLLLDANERVAETAAVTNGKLDVIHTLVNSNMTAAMQAELDATVRELAMMHEVIDMKRAAGAEPSVAALAAVEATATKIDELQVTLADRLKQNEKVEALVEREGE